MNKILKVLGIVLMFLVPTAKAWAEQHVVTIYFAGTGLNEDWWQPDLTRWKNNQELLATLFHEQDATAPNQHKQFVAGIGAKPDCGDVDGLAQMGAPFLNICRNWAKTINEGRTFLEDILNNQVVSGDNVILNLVGYSRGAVSTGMFANLVETLDPNGVIAKLNILSVDPAPGLVVPGDARPASDRVTKLVVIFAQDERSNLFGALIPYYDKTITDAWMFRVRGSHETVAGNLQIRGHSIDFASLDKTAYGGLKIIYDLAAITAVELLGSPQWGNVAFSTVLSSDLYFLGLSDADRKAAYLRDIQVMNEAEAFDPNINYELMRKSSTVPLLESYRNEFLFGWTCWPADLVLGPLFGIHNAPRCARRIDQAGSAPWRGLEYQTDIPLIGVGMSGNDAWARIQKLGTTDLDPDDDNDGILDEDDNCPLLANPAQTDHDSDGVGDACDDDDDNDEVADVVDNCPLDANTDQKNNDSDAQGDVCDPDDDNDGVLDTADNCVFTANPDQKDTDLDGEGDVCDVNDIQAKCVDVTVVADASCKAAAIIDAGSFDPDGDAVDAVPSPPGPYALGDTNVTLTIDDILSIGRDDVPAMCSAKVTVVDESAPAVTARLDTTGRGDDDDDDDDERRLRVSFSATDNCSSNAGLTCAATLKVPGCRAIKVKNGQRIEFEREGDECEIERDGRVLEIEGPSLTLSVSCTDAAGNTGTAQAVVAGRSSDRRDRRGRRGRQRR